MYVFSLFIVLAYKKPSRHHQGSNNDIIKNIMKEMDIQVEKIKINIAGGLDLLAQMKQKLNKAWKRRLQQMVQQASVVKKGPTDLLNV